METNFCSQYRDITQEEWKSRACSICALWMALKVLKNDFTLSVDDLLEEGLKIKAWGEAGFWIHNKIAILAHNYGIPAYAEEFKSIPFGAPTKYAENLRDYGVEKIFNFLKNKEGVVLVSVPKGFDHIDKPHSVLFHDVKEDEDGRRYFIYNDSEKESEEDGQNIEVWSEDFRIKWRRLAIFLNRV